VLDNLSSNQRLMLAVALSVIFFVVYTAIFPPVQPEEDVAQKSQKVELKQDSVTQTTTDTTTNQRVEAAAGHTISQQDAIASTSSSDIVTVNSKDFILKIDTLGRISSKELLQEKFNDKEGNHAQLISPFSTKPLFIRFLDENLNKEATSVAYTSSVSEITLSGEAQKVTLTQKLSNLTVVKELTFYADGHYDATVSLSKDKRYFIYVGQRPRVNETEQMMAAAGAMIYNDQEILTIIEDGDAEGRQSFSGVEIVATFDQYTAIVIYGLSKDTNVIIDRATWDFWKLGLVNNCTYSFN